MRLLGVKTAYHCHVVSSLFSNNGQKISSKTQNERWMGTGGKSICDNYIFRKHSQKSPGKHLKFDRKSPGKPWKRISFHCWPPCLYISEKEPRLLAPMCRIRWMRLMKKPSCLICSKGVCQCTLCSIECKENKTGFMK